MLERGRARCSGGVAEANLRKNSPQTWTAADIDRSEIGPYQGCPRADSGGPKKTVSDGVKTNETCGFKNY